MLSFVIALGLLFARPQAPAAPASSVAVQVREAGTTTAIPRARITIIGPGVRETGTSAAIGADGGSTGGIEWVNLDGQSIIADGRAYVVLAPWVSIFPGLALTITVLAVYFFGDGLRDLLDPRMRTL